MPQASPVHVGVALGRLRVARGLSQDELADLTGKRRQYVSQVENGLNITVRTLALFAEALGVSASDVLARAEQIAGEEAQAQASGIAQSSVRP